MKKTTIVTLCVAAVLAVGAGAYKCRSSLTIKETIKETIATSSGDTGKGDAQDDASKSSDSDASDEARDSSSSGSTATVSNETKTDVTVYVAFGSNSSVLPAAWSSFCINASGLTCNFTVGAKSVQTLPLSDRYLNATFSFGSPVGCGVTKAEVNVNNPKWYDVLDVSLVDGYSNEVAIYATTFATTLNTSAETTTETTTRLGPPNGSTGNEKVLGLFPLGCDICTARQSPPCGMKPGRDGCKAGSQYKPDVPCQWQGSKMGGGTTVRIAYLGNLVPAAQTAADAAK